MLNLKITGQGQVTAHKGNVIPDSKPFNNKERLLAKSYSIKSASNFLAMGAKEPHNALKTNSSYVKKGSKIPSITSEIIVESLDESNESCVIDSESDCNDKYIKTVVIKSSNIVDECEEDIQSDKDSVIKPEIQETSKTQLRINSNIARISLFALSRSNSKFDKSFIDFFKRHTQLKTYINKVKEELSAKEELNNEDKHIKELKELIEKKSAAEVIDFMASKSRFVTFPDFSFFVSEHPEFKTYLNNIPNKEEIKFFYEMYIAKGKEITEDNINNALEQLILYSPLDAVRNILPAKNDIKGKIFSELKDCYKEITSELALEQIAVKKHIVAEALFPSGTFGHSHEDAICRFDTLFGNKGQELLKAIDIKQKDVMISSDYSKTEGEFRQQIIIHLADFINNKEKAGENQITQDLDLINRNYFDSLWGETGNEKLTKAIESSDLYRKIADTKSDNKFSPEELTSTLASSNNSNKSSIAEEIAEEGPPSKIINAYHTKQVKFKAIHQKKITLRV